MAKTHVRLGLKSLIVAAGLTIASIGGYGGVLLYTDNFHVVSEGALYRSAQLTKGEFETAIREYHIRSILNLRGAHPAEAWYQDEIEVSRRASIKHYDLPLSAKRPVGGEEIAAILEILQHAPKPLLIHCKSGSDRSGLVAALFRFAIERASPDAADRQLSLVYGHFPYLTSRSGAMDKSFWAFVDHSGGALLRR